MLPKKIIQFLAYVIISVVNPILNITHGKKITLICQEFLAFILLSWISSCYAQAQSSNSTFDKLVTKIHSHTVCGIKYNPSKTAAIVDEDCRSAVYINFKTQQTYAILDNKLAYHISPTWINNSIATIETSCGTGCVNVVIFVSPATVVSCADHEYRIKFLNEHVPPDYYHNRPLLIDPKKGIYVCYDEDKNIQVFPLPIHVSIRPPKGYFSEKAIIRNNHLIIFYKNAHEKTKQVSYDY